MPRGRIGEETVTFKENIVVDVLYVILETKAEEENITVFLIRTVVILVNTIL